MAEVLGLDIGGANLKGAHSGGVGRTVAVRALEKSRGIDRGLARAGGPPCPRTTCWR